MIGWEDDKEFRRMRMQVIQFLVILELSGLLLHSDQFSRMSCRLWLHLRWRKGFNLPKWII